MHFFILFIKYYLYYCILLYIIYVKYFNDIFSIKYDIINMHIICLSQRFDSDDDHLF